MNANTASDADLLTVPGATQAWVDKVKQGRPYKTTADLEKAAGTVNARFFVVE
jgi:DNA uptake protein ComE-like DNA-binding protein